MFETLTPFFKWLKLVEAFRVILGQENNSGKKNVIDNEEGEEEEDEEECVTHFE